MKIFFNFWISLILILLLQVGCVYEDSNDKDYNNLNTGIDSDSSADTGNTNNSNTSNNSSNSSDTQTEDDKPVFLQLPYIENFDTELDTSIWTKSSNVTTVPVSAVTTHDYSYIHDKTSTIKLSYYNSELSRIVNISEPCAVTFSFYPDGYHSSQKFHFYINNEEKGCWNGAGIKQTYTFLLPHAGEYELKWATTSGGYYLTGGGNDVYIDSVSIAADKTDSVIIYPQAVQTVVLGNSLTYTARALRTDASVIAEKTVTQDFTATKIGKQIINMEIDGKTATATANVVSADSLTEPFSYMGNTYNGIDMSTVSGSSENVNQTSNYTDLRDLARLEITYPEGNTFSADGFFPLKLKANNPDMYQFIYIVISNNTNSEGYIYRGNPDSTEGELETRIWLRWGVGVYTVEVYDLALLIWKYEAYDQQKNTSADGKIIYRGDNIASISRYPDYPAVTFTVTNTRDEDGTWLYPSHVIQADDFGIMNKAADLTYGLTNVTDKVKAIHDWIVTSKYYDHDSLLQGCRKRQDAIAVMEYGMGVCEGYANLAAAMLRSVGIQVKYISSTSLAHGWNHVNIGTVENPDWRLMDCTWDDPTINEDMEAFVVLYNNFLLTDFNGGGHTGNDHKAINRSIISQIGHFDGTESIAY